MKVYILTFVNTVNYGALLQAFSLRANIVSLGYDCEFINYQNQRLDYSTVSLYRRLRSFIVQNLIIKPLFSRKRKARTKLFQRDMLQLRAPKYHKPCELGVFAQRNGIYVVGSDQVWNPDLIENDESYLLSFAGGKKIAYAASFGKNGMPEKYYQRYNKYLNRFHAISVRENSGAEFLKKILNIEANVLLDPVFLFDATDWNSRLQLQDISVRPGGYVLCYVMPGETKTINSIYTVAKAISDQKGIPIITLGKREYSRATKEKAEILEFDAGPREFVKYLSCADYVVTNSFHGTAFSIIYRKKFWTVAKKSSDPSPNTRMRELLNRFGLEDRIAYVDAEPAGAALTAEVDYGTVENTLAAEIERAKDFLRISLSEDV